MAGLFDKSKKLIRGVTESNTVEYQKEFSANMTRAFTISTPVDTGRAVANWKAAINKEPTPNENIFDKSVSTKKTIDILRKDISGLKFKDTVIIKNAVSNTDDGVESFYILKLENGHSKQAPTGMFRKNVARYKQISKKTIKKLGL